MTNLSLKIQQSKFDLAREAMEKAMAPRKTYRATFVYDENNMIHIFYEDQFDSEYKITVPLVRIIRFINDFYSTVIDTHINGEHHQFEDTTNLLTYYEENTKAVVTDFLNHSK